MNSRGSHCVLVTAERDECGNVASRALNAVYRALNSPSAQATKCVRCSVVSNSLRPLRLGPEGSCIHRILQQEYWEWVAYPSSGNLPDLGIKSGSPALQADSLPSKPPWQPH